ncbi:MAG: hypothetical protein MUE46_11250 [Xanthomonadales bacterium]|jgi:hypothetical protein|nr:hypothetical protein [Xanthomonadales bacterium]
MPDDRLIPDLPDAPDDDRIAAALRGLPLAAPPESRFAAIRTELAQDPPARRRTPADAWWMALAASIVAFVVWQADPTDALHAPAELGALASVETLSARSRATEQRLAEARQQTRALGADQALLEREIEGALELIDLQLARASTPEDALPLWRNRIRLLETLAELAEAPSGSAAFVPASPIAAQDPEASPDDSGEI